MSRTEALGAAPEAGSAATEPFEQLARELAERDRECAAELPSIERALARLRAAAEQRIGAFVETAGGLGAKHLVHVEVGPVEPDEKHVDCLQFKVRRGRHEVVCVGKSRGVVTLVGPYRAGKPERPCQEHPLPSPEADRALHALLLQFLREATGR